MINGHIDKQLLHNDILHIQRLSNNDDTDATRDDHALRRPHEEGEEAEEAEAVVQATEEDPGQLSSRHETALCLRLLWLY